MTDNFNIFKKYIEKGFSESTLEDCDTYYVIEILRRGKDNPELPAANIHFKNYYIRKIEDVDKYEEEIKILCNQFKMRAYFSVNYKSFKQVTLDTLAEIANRVANNDYKKPYNIFESCSGKYYHNSNKRWIIDLDNCDVKSNKVKKCKNILDIIKPRGVEKLKEIVPTKSGVHLITAPFDVKEFEIVYDGTFSLDDPNNLPDIKKNHLSLLYENI